MADRRDPDPPGRSRARHVSDLSRRAKSLVLQECQLQIQRAPTRRATQSIGDGSSTAGANGACPRQSVVSMHILILGRGWQVTACRSTVSHTTHSARMMAHGHTGHQDSCRRATGAITPSLRQRRPMSWTNCASYRLWCAASRRSVTRLTAL